MFGFDLSIQSVVSETAETWVVDVVGHAWNGLRPNKAFRRATSVTRQLSAAAREFLKVPILTPASGVCVVPILAPPRSCACQSARR